MVILGTVKTNKKDYAEFLIDLATINEVVRDKAKTERDKDSRDFLELLANETSYLLRKFNELIRDESV